MLSIISINESNKWDEVVKSFNNYDIYYISSYVKAFQIHGDGEPLLFHYEDNDIRAINVVMKRDIAKDYRFTNKLPLNTYFDIITPYGYGGFLIEGDIKDKNLNNLKYEYEAYCNESGIISEFVRFHPVLDNSKHLKSIYEVINLGKTISIELKSSEYVWDNITSKNKNVIRKAIKNDVQIFWGRNTKLVDEFINMYYATMDKDNADKYYYFKKDFFNSILNDLKYNFLIFYAVYKQIVISISMILFCNKQMHYHLSASNKEYLSYAPTNLLLYEAACWGANNGYNTFHLGGGLGSREDNLYKFKKAFNKNCDNKFFIGKKIFNDEKYYELVKLRTLDKNYDIHTTFFPVYRA